MRYVGTATLIVVVGAALVTSLFLSVQRAQRRALQSTCKGHLKQISVALFNYHDDHGVLPPDSMLGPNGHAHSWRVLILPYIAEHELYDRYRFDEPWDGPNNSLLAERIPTLYQCPSFENRGLDTPHSRQLTNYVAFEHPNATFGLPLDDIGDGLSETLLLVETRQHSVHWMQPNDVTPIELLVDLQSAAHADRANHVGGLHGLNGDGSVEFIPSDTPFETLRARVTSTGGEVVDSPP